MRQPRVSLERTRPMNLGCRSLPLTSIVTLEKQIIPLLRLFTWVKIVHRFAFKALIFLTTMSFPLSGDFNVKIINYGRPRR